jgi:excisionase family DNA binding protein
MCSTTGVAYPAYVREKARQLRETKRLTIDQLAARLGISRTTIYYWVRDIPIPGSGPGGGWPEAARRKGNRTVRRKYRLLREEAYERGSREFGELAADPTFRDFVCLYIAEGYKRSRHSVSICNSDPAVVMLGNAWIKRFARNPVRYSFQYHADQDVRKLKAFWGAQFDVDPTEIKCQPKSNDSRLRSRTWRCRYGVLAVTTHDTLLRARLEAWIDCIRASWT